MAFQTDFPLPVLDALQFGAHRLSLLTDQALFEKTGVRVAFSSRQGGVSQGPFASLNCAFGVGDDDVNVARNIVLTCESVGADPDRAVLARQVHGIRIREVGHDVGLEVGAGLSRAVDGGGAPELVECDGVVSDVAEVPVIIRAADCVLLVIVASTGRFAVVHAGWRGAVGHIARQAARALAEGDGVRASLCNAYIGPHIREECFEVAQDVEERFVRAFGAATVPQPGHVSLSAAIRADLLEAGFDERRICDAGICTCCHADEFFSYRGSKGVCGRGVALAYRASAR